MHADAVDGIELPEVLQPLLEVLNGLMGVAVGDGHIFVVVAYFVSEIDDSLYDVGVVGAWCAAEVIDGLHAEFSFYFR